MFECSKCAYLWSKEHMKGIHFGIRERFHVNKGKKLISPNPSFMHVSACPDEKLTNSCVDGVLELDVVVVALLEERLCVDHVLADGAGLPRPIGT
jgi:hypothetical protein